MQQSHILDAVHFFVKLTEQCFAFCIRLPFPFLGALPFRLLGTMEMILIRASCA